MQEDNVKFVVQCIYGDGFMSLMPTSGHGDFFFRIKDDREANEWHDIMCRKAVPGQWAAEQIGEKFRGYQQEKSFLGTDGRK